MGFTNDYSQAYEAGGLKPEGDYEVIITKAEEKRTKSSGKTYLSLSMVIRNDVDQKYQNAYLFHALWKRKEPTESDMQVNGYGFSQIMSMGKAAGLPNGKQYASLEDFLTELMKKPVKAHLVHDEYNGEKRESIAWFAATDHPEVRHVMKKRPDVEPDGYAAPAQQTTYAAQTAQAPIGSLSEEDLPF